jgi:hypothetical protein
MYRGRDACMEVVGNSYRILLKIPVRPLGRLSLGWENNIKTNLRKVGMNVGWINCRRIMNMILNHQVAYNTRNYLPS